MNIRLSVCAVMLCLLSGGANVGRVGAQTSAAPAAAPSASASPSASTSASASRLASALDAILDAPALQNDFVGACVMRVRDGQVLYARNADRVFLPASNNKLLTSFAALQMLPSDFAYHTQVRTRGEVDEDGTLRGDLLLVGGGDPVLSLANLDALAQQLAAAGVRDIRGGLRYDDKRYDRQWLGVGWTWDDEAASYSAQISALNVNANCVSVQVLPGKRAGDAARVQVTPSYAAIRVENRAVTGLAKSASSIVIDRARGQNVIVVTGALAGDADTRTQSAVDVTVENPARFTATLFEDALKRAGIRVHDRKILPLDEGVKPGVTIAPARLLAEHVSPPLPQLLLRMNKPSDNLMAECLLKAVGAFGKASGAAVSDAPASSSSLIAAPAFPASVRVGTSGAEGTGAQTARQAFAAAGMNLNGVRQVDGSGLSRGNYVSPRNLARLLVAAQSRSWFPVLYASLPIAGVDGTLRNRMKNTPAMNNCRAKSGSLSHVSCLSGYVTTPNGDLLAFSLLMNNHLGPMRACTLAQDDVVNFLAAYTPNTAAANVSGSAIGTFSRYAPGTGSASESNVR